ncbi:aminopeptidase N-like [Chironomus tepperi]|uniref:aminopeptidase N-like n=1 Tax=Chironomus tepperi TaxID=113505 RepID=UPI00391F599F
MKLLVTIISVYLVINSVCSNPVDKTLQNKGLIERKFKVFESEGKQLKLDEELTYRLPNDSIPINYEITLSTNVHEGDFNFTGKVKIRVKIVEPTDKITLHYKNITIDKVDIFNALVPVPILLNAPFDHIESHDFLIINLPNIFDKDAEILISIAYHGQLRDDGAGFYKGSYKDEAGVAKYYGATQFEVTDARHAFPCYDEPGIRAEMTLTIIHGKSYTAIANTEVAEQREDETGNYWSTTFATTPKMQTYILAFVISDFDYVNSTENSRIPQRIYGVPKAIREGQGDFAANVVGQILGKLEEILDVKYPLSKMDHVALTTFNFGAMENIGLITYFHNSLLLDPSLPMSLYEYENGIISIISHEYAHQWFGNIVSPTWWQYTWLNEGFATLFTEYIPQLVYPERGSMRNFHTSVMPIAFASDEMGSWAMNHYTEDPDKLWDKFGGIGYSKSGCVLRMFMEVMTEPVFLKGLNYYLTDNYMQAATPAELHAGLQKAYNEAYPSNPLDIGELMYTWENQPGYPLITVTVSGSNLTFSQRRYPQSDNEIYSVPLTFATQTNPDFTTKTPKIWLRTQSLQVSQTLISYNPNNWIVMNIDQVGYYRVDYDTTLWNGIINQLLVNHTVINPINRAVLQNEFYLGCSEFNRVNAGDALRLLSYYGVETESIVWNAGNVILKDLNQHLYGTAVYEQFLKFIRGITKPHLKAIGYDNIDGEDPERTNLRIPTKTWNCLALDDDCFLNEYEKFLDFYENQDIVNFDFCNALRIADKEIFEELLTQVASNYEYANRDKILKSLGCSLDPENLEKLFGEILNIENVLNSDERDKMLQAVVSKSVLGLEMSLEFVEESYTALNIVLDLYETMYKIASYINSDPNTSRFVKILSKLQEEELISVENHQKILDRIAKNNEWFNKHYHDVLVHFEVEETTDSMPTTTPNSASCFSMQIQLIVICGIVKFITTMF